MRAFVSWLRRNFAPVLFAIGLALMILLAGIVVGSAHLFPYTVLNAAQDAALDLKENWRHYLGIRSNYALATNRTQGGVIKHDQQLAFDGYTFITAYGAGGTQGYNAYLLDMEGRVVHEWDASMERIWPDRNRIASIDEAGGVPIQGAYLFGNGDVLDPRISAMRHCGARSCRG